MTKLRTATIVAVASAMAVTFFGSLGSAHAGPAGVRQTQHVGHVNRGHFNRGHVHRGHSHRGGGFRGYGGIAATIVGLAIVSSQIAAANEHRETVARARYNRAANARVRTVKRTAAPIPMVAPVRVAAPIPMADPLQRDCEFAAEWEKLVKSAEGLLAEDKRMHAQYGEDVRDGNGNVVRTGYSIDIVRFQESELEWRREELRKAKEACGRAAAGPAAPR